MEAFEEFSGTERTVNNTPAVRNGSLFLLLATAAVMAEGTVHSAGDPTEFTIFEYLFLVGQLVTTFSKSVCSLNDMGFDVGVNCTAGAPRGVDRIGLGSISAP